jgi:hypothetical protein
VLCVVSPDWRGPGLPVISKFLKLSTSMEALLLPGPTLSVPVRLSPLPLSCGSMDANVLEKGFAGIPLGDVAGRGAW